MPLWQTRYLFWSKEETIFQLQFLQKIFDYMRFCPKICMIIQDLSCSLFKRLIKIPNIFLDVYLLPNYQLRSQTNRGKLSEIVLALQKIKEIHEKKIPIVFLCCCITALLYYQFLRYLNKCIWLYIFNFATCIYIYR